jgi:threonylcarbamoyladenosine tRNA methylthiotransferase MtaB
MIKKVKLFTLGCKVNQYETQGLREQLQQAGYIENNSPKADLYIINTCTVTHQADRESRRLIRKAARSSPQAKIVVTGCYAERETKEILGISERIQIVPKSKDFSLRISDFKDHQRAFVKIQDGCNNRCAYCKVPLVRGDSRSRSPKGIIQEVSRLVEGGFKEIVLTGICLGDYHYRDYDLTGLLQALEKIKGKFRIRLSSIEPQLVHDRLIEYIADSQRVCAHLHIPLQSGDDVILKMMNRKYSIKGYLALVSRINKRIKDVAITTDVLVGFPGEEDKHFQNTRDCLSEILPLRTHIFSFSPRKGTAAFKLPGRSQPGIVKERMNLLRQTAAECSDKFRKKFLGKEITVLIESQSDKESGFFCGYSENYIRVVVEGTTQKDVNRLLRVKISHIDTNDGPDQIRAIY